MTRIQALGVPIKINLDWLAKKIGLDPWKKEKSMVFKERLARDSHDGFANRRAYGQMPKQEKTIQDLINDFNATYENAPEVDLTPEEAKEIAEKYGREIEIPAEEIEKIVEEETEKLDPMGLTKTREIKTKEERSGIKTFQDSIDPKKL